MTDKAFVPRHRVTCLGVDGRPGLVPQYPASAVELLSHVGPMTRTVRDAALMLGVAGFREAGYASEHDALIAQKLAYILTGAALAEPQWVDQQYLLNLEREAFLSLIMETKTQERILHMLQTNKPLRN